MHALGGPWRRNTDAVALNCDTNNYKKSLPRKVLCLVHLSEVPSDRLSSTSLEILFHRLIELNATKFILIFILDFILLNFLPLLLVRT